MLLSRQPRRSTELRRNWQRLSEALSGSRSLSSNPDETLLDVRLSISDVATGAVAALPWQVVRCNPTGGGFTVTLPPASEDLAGSPVIVKNASASTNTITIDGDGSETVDGAASAAISSAWGVVRLVCDGANWLTI